MGRAVGLLFSGCVMELSALMPSLARDSLRVYYFVGLKVTGPKVTSLLKVRSASMSGEGLELGRHVARGVKTFNGKRALSL